MSQEYTFTLSVTVDDEQRVWDTAKKRLTSAQMEAGSVEEYLGPRDAPRMEDCLRMIFDPGVSPDGCDIEESSCEAVRPAAEPVIEYLTIVPEPDPDEPIILVISDPEKSAWENFEAQHPEMAALILADKIEFAQRFDGNDDYLTDVRAHEDLCERTAEEVQEFIDEFTAPMPLR